MIERRKIKKAVAYAMLLCFTSLTGAQPLYAIPANTQLPDIAQAGAGVQISKPDNTVMNVHQTGQTAVNQWNNFSIGADATVNFTGDMKNFNSFNYVKNGGPVSEIYGQLNALGGNIFIANPAGVQIGNSAQINVGSLYITNKNLEDELGAIGAAQNAQEIRSIIASQQAGTAELMSLGSITSATNVTFDGGRIVLDTDRLFTSATGTAGETPMDIFNADNSPLTIRTNDEKNVVLGYTAYESDSPDEVGTFDTTEKKFNNLTVAVVNEDNEVTEKSASVNGYMWVEDVFQLQAMGSNYIDGWFALRNAIDANYTASMNGGKGFDPIGNTANNGDAFTGRFDGLDYHIFGLTINRGGEDNVGLFGNVKGDAIIRNVTLNGGSITGGNNVGSIAGSVSGSATIENITNTADVTGTTNVGGVIGSLDGTSGTPDVHGFANSGTVSGVTNVGGIVGEAGGVTLDGKIYNLGAVVGIDDEANNKWSSNVGGIVGHATNTTIGSSAFQIYNQLGVTGGYNVGGIVGSIEGDSKITNVANHGDVTATRYTTETYSYHNYDDNEWKDISINNVTVANAGGIAGKSGDSDSNSDKITINISNVENHGDVTTEQDNLDDGTKYYIAGNVGGIVGRARYTDITNAENTENLVAGAHNVGGIAGYLNEGKIDTAGNNGGEITATGARSDSGDFDLNNGFVQETVNVGGAEAVNIGNIGGIVGYLQGNAARIKNAANRGDVHSAYIDEDAATVPQTAEAANAGGVVGKVSMKAYTDDMNGSDLLAKLQDENNYDYATISNSYNTGNVAGYTGVGGVAGQMVKGSVAGSYNLGTVRSTRIADPGTVQPLNMGGIVGDTSVATDGSGTVIYDVYNAGQIGDDTYTYLGRHVGGVVGRLGGTLEKAYNTGDIYNGYSVTGGVVGYWVSGNIKNVFNTGNVTVVNKDLNARNSLVGGIVGAALSTNDKTLSYAYNLGTLRSFIPKEYERIELSSDPIDGTLATVDAEKYTPQEIDSYQWIVDNVIFDDGDDSTQGSKYDRDKAYQLENINVVGGIIGGVTETPDGTTAQKNVTISNVYTTGNIYAGRWNAAANEGKGGYTEATKGDTPDRISAIWGTAYTNGGDNVDLSNSYFIEPLETSKEGDAKYTKPTTYNELDDDHIIAWENRMDKDSYSDWTIDNGVAGDPDEDGWRMYDKDSNNYGMQTLPMLNAFTPNSAKDQSWKTGVEGIGSVQYGTAANPLLTIINAEKNTDGTYKDVELNWSTLGISGAGSLAVYDGNLTINGFSTTLGSYFNGIIFSDGDLTINANGDGDAHNLGSGSRVYGTSVNFNAGTNDTTLYGSVTSTNGDINISGGNVSVIGSLTSSKKGQATQVEGIAKNGNTADSGVEAIKMEDLKNPDAEITTVEKAYSYMANASEEHPTTAPTVENGSIKVEASGSAEVLYGNMKDGRIDAAEDFTVKGKESVYVDSDLHIGKDLNLASDGEIVLDLSNMGSYDSVNEKGETITGKENLHRNFLDHFKNAGAINVSGEGADGFMIALDMWDDGKDAFDLDKYDVSDGDYDNAKVHELAADIKDLTISLNNKELDDNGAQAHTFIWIDGAEQLNGIQAYKDANDKAIADDPATEATHILEYNFALKDNIDASQLEDYKGIAADEGEAFTGTFDGRGFSIIGLDANDDGTDSPSEVKDAGIFGTIGDGGEVRDLNVYSSQFTGEDTAGAIAGRNEGTITNVTTFGNTVKVTGTAASTTIEKGKSTGDSEKGKTVYVGAAGGIAGVNTGSITDVHASDTVIASEGGNITNPESFMTVAGGVVGINKVDEDGGSAGSLGEFSIGGPAGVVSNSAVITDISTEKSEILHGLGGVAGINEGIMFDVAALGATDGAYGATGAVVNEYVGGVIGVNYSPGVYGAYNESAVIGASNVGGIVGKNDYRDDLKTFWESDDYPYNGGELSQVVNAGNVTAISDILGQTDKTTSNAGGIAGSNYGIINNGRNTGTVTGVDSVGGIVGFNADGAEITNLSNAIAAEITGKEYVGGIAGNNAGEITAESNLVNEGKITGVQYVGGIAGTNSGTIHGGESETGSGAELTNRAEITGTQYVGGIAGKNEESGTITNTNAESTITAKKDESGKITEEKYFGGVTGTNSGTIINATNTGTVTATGATLVGGITGENTESGELLNAGNSGDVSGLAQVGGVAGVNSSQRIEGTIVNSGNITAEQDGAAGIFYVNNAALDGVTLRNDGTVGKEGVTGTAGGETGTGGVIGINNGDITNSTLTNNFTVNGGNNTGGVIGINNADISDSSLISTVNSYVKGGDNTGGLIGKNTGSVEGGRNDADTMYEHKIYNNGGVHGTGDNTGGLIGKNEGTLTAGYNTGSVTGVNNVGGVVGTNSGTISEVFNTIMTGEETGNNVSGAGNAGGIVGNNAQNGILTDAYNTTAVESQGTKGNAVGENSGTVENVYAANTDGKLVGSNNGTVTNSYTFSAEDETDGVTMVTGDAQKQSGSYEGFKFGSVWKNYDGWTTPMLKVFLTKASYNGSTSVTQTGGAAGLPVSGVTAADGLLAYYNVNGLLVPILNSMPGSDYMAFYSQQIGASYTGGFNPNWLGYDIDVTYEIIPVSPVNAGHLFQDGWDRMRNFRERKAELHFVNGGMEYAEDM